MITWQNIMSKVLPILELYRCVQSEGSRFGIPTIAVRTTGCTHRCYFGEGGWCDSWYTSIHPEKGRYTREDVHKIYDDNPHIHEMMLTGGSPSMHPELVNDLMWFAHERGIFVTMETEGSHAIETDIPIDLISLSPKFSNSVPVIGAVTPKGKVVDQKFVDTHNRYRLKLDTIEELISYHSDYHFKPVVNPIEQPDVWDEVLSVITELDIPMNKVYIMPPGDNREELIRVYPMIFEFCAETGYRMTGRDHIIAFDTDREV